MEVGSIVAVFEVTGSNSVEFEMTGSSSARFEMIGSNSVLDCMGVEADSNSVVIEKEEIADSSSVVTEMEEIAGSNSVLGEVDVEGVVVLGPSGDKMAALVEVGMKVVVYRPAHGAVSSGVYSAVGVVVGVAPRVQALPNTRVDYSPTV